LVVFVVIPGVLQKNSTRAPAARSNVPAAVAQLGSTASVRVIPVSGTVFGLCTVIRQNAVPPGDTVASGAHGPVPPTPQSAGVADSQISFVRSTPNRSAVAEPGTLTNGCVPGGEPGGGGTVADAVLVVSAVRFGVEQKTSCVAPAATLNVPAAVTHDGSTTSDRVIPSNVVVPGLDTEMRQNAVDPATRLVDNAHGPVADRQSATTVDAHTCLTTLTENTFTVADDSGEVNGGVPGGAPGGGGTVTVARLVVVWTRPVVEHRIGLVSPGPRSNVSTHDGSPGSTTVTPVRAVGPGLVTVIRQNAVATAGSVVDAAQGPAPD
jgi:hypothetical protein